MGFGHLRSSTVEGDPKHEIGSVSSTPGSFVTALSVTIPVNKARNLLAAYAVSIIDSEWRLIDPDTLEVFGFGRTDPGRSKDEFFWSPTLKISASGTERTIEFQIKVRGSTPVDTVKGFLMSTEVNI